MDRYPKPLDPTRDSALRRISEIGLGAGIAALLAFAASPEVATAGWIIAWVTFVFGVAVILWDEIRLWQLDARAWSTDQWNLLRRRNYQLREGLFLVHWLDPIDGHNWKLTVRLMQHREGPLSEGRVKEVEYVFGEKFQEGPFRWQDPTDGFAYSTSIYGPLLVLARVVFKNRLRRPLLIERYVDLPEDGESKEE